LTTSMGPGIKLDIESIQNAQEAAAA
jgi:hypothetical protein